MQLYFFKLRGKIDRNIYTAKVTRKIRQIILEENLNFNKLSSKYLTQVLNFIVSIISKILLLNEYGGRAA